MRLREKAIEYAFERCPKQDLVCYAAGRNEAENGSKCKHF